MTPKLIPGALLLAVHANAFAGTISLSNTAYPDSIVVQVTIDDTGEVAGCPYLALQRDGGDVFYIARQMGTTITRRFVDTDVEPNTLYCYGMALRALPAPFQFPCGGSLCDAFYCFYLIATCANTGPDPAFIGHGLLSTRWPDGTPVDNNETRALLYLCNDALTPYRGFTVIPPEASAYLDTGTGVDVYGTWGCCWAQGMWFLVAQAFVPHSCTLAVHESTWGRVKSLYRD